MYRERKEISLLSIIQINPYISRVMARREVFKSLPYEATAPITPYYYEDWHFICQCAAKGANMLVAKNTITYYRQRAGSLMSQARVRQAQQIAPSDVFTPERYVEIAQDDYVKWRSGLVMSNRPLPKSCELLSPLLGDIQFHNHIDPEIDIDAIIGSNLFDNQTYTNLAIGAAYFECCKIIKNFRYKHVFILPFHLGAGADLYLQKIIESIYATDMNARVLVILGESSNSGSVESRFAPNCTVLNLARDWPLLSLDDRLLVSFKLIQSVASEAFVHVRQSEFGGRFLKLYKEYLTGNNIVLYPFSLGSVYKNGKLFNSQHSWQYVRDNVRRATYLITDNKSIIGEFCRIYDDPQQEGKWKCIRTPHAERSPPKAAYGRGDGQQLKALWASRIDWEKRPQLVVAIAKQLSRQQSEIHIDMFGSCMLSDASLGVVDAQALTRRGSFTRFFDIDTSDYFCFIYTSMFDGMPNVLVEAAYSGLPIIAPNVGGISEFIENEVTGILLPSLEDERKMAGLYVAALRRLRHDRDLRNRLATTAFERARSMFSLEAHQRAVGEIFGGLPATRGSDPTTPCAESQVDVEQPTPMRDGACQTEFLESQNEALRRQLRLANESRSDLAKLEQRHGRELADQNERVRFLEAQNSALQDTLQTERERLGATNGAQRPDNLLSRTATSIWFDGRSLPLSVFWALAKVWQKPRKRRFLEIVLRVIGVKIR
jgi:glycosyltransferase involved in cell wall biosynthesis